MAITTNMGSYEIDTDSIETAYDDEIMCAGWNPDVDLACHLLPLESSDPHTGMSADLATEIPELFLSKMYSYQE